MEPTKEQIDEMARLMDAVVVYKVVRNKERQVVWYKPETAIDRFDRAMKIIKE